MKLKNQRIAILGAGKSGISASELALSLGAEVSIYDEGISKLPDHLNLSYFPHFEMNLKKEETWDMVVVSPGICISSDFVSYFSEKTDLLISEIEFASLFFEGEIVAITGTNGKTTMLNALQHICNHYAVPSKIAGNNGVPFSKVVCDSGGSYPLIFLELSSFQLELIHQFFPQVAVLMNLSPDHLDRYSCLDEYYKAKFRIFENQTEKNMAILPSKLPFMHNKEIIAHRLFFSELENSDCFIKSSNVFVKGQLFLSLNDEIRFKLGALENLLPFILVCSEFLSFTGNQVLSALQSFSPPPHRYEWIASLNQVSYINDSKSTNPASLEKALDRQNEKVVLICGGKEKGADFSFLIPKMKEKIACLICIGENADSLFQLFSKFIPSHLFNNLDDAVFFAKSMALPNQIVLFSPASSSLDLYQNYEERGNHFRFLVKTLLNN